jgi:hypothetical protein
LTIVAVPEVEDEVLMEIVTESPALKEIPWKLTQAAGNHSYQAKRGRESQLCDPSISKESSPPYET